MVNQGSSPNSALARWAAPVNSLISLGLGFPTYKCGRGGGRGELSFKPIQRLSLKLCRFPEGQWGPRSCLNVCEAEAPCQERLAWFFQRGSCPSPSQTSLGPQTSRSNRHNTFPVTPQALETAPGETDATSMVKGDVVLRQASSHLQLPRGKIKVIAASCWGSCGLAKGV